MSLIKKVKWELVGKLKEKLWKKNVYEVPKIEKIVINVWIWTYLQRWSWRNAEEVVDNIAKVTWQKPVVINTKLSVSNFKLRKWAPNWVKVTLRWEKMYAFLDKLISIVFPRTRDFRWISKTSFDKDWNYVIWIKDIAVFPEINMEDISKTHWLQINFSINSKWKE
jgi:large subunit ribosomal protein L5